jgi:hypothetical protein
VLVGFDVGDSEDGMVWTPFPALAQGPPPGRDSAGHLPRPHRSEEGDRRVAARRARQRRRLHFMRNVLAEVPKGNQEMVSAARRSCSSPTWIGSNCLRTSRDRPCSLIQARIAEPPAAARLHSRLCRPWATFSCRGAYGWSLLWGSGRRAVTCRFPPETEGIRLAGQHPRGRVHRDRPLPRRSSPPRGSAPRMTPSAVALGFGDAADLAEAHGFRAGRLPYQFWGRVC